MYIVVINTSIYSSFHSIISDLPETVSHSKPSPSVYTLCKICNVRHCPNQFLILFFIFRIVRTLVRTSFFLLYKLISSIVLRVYGFNDSSSQQTRRRWPNVGILRAKAEHMLVGEVMPLCRHRWEPGKCPTTKRHLWVAPTFPRPSPNY